MFCYIVGMVRGGCLWLCDLDDYCITLFMTSTALLMSACLCML
jgi:hypothetical protein